MSHVPSSLNSRTETLPSLLAQARTAPTSCGAHWTELTRCVSWRLGGGKRGSGYRRRGGLRARTTCSRSRVALARLSPCRRRRHWRGCSQTWGAPRRPARRGRRGCRTRLLAGALEGEAGGGDIPAEGLEETVVVAVDFEDLNGLVGGAGLGNVSRERRRRVGGVDVRRGVCRSSPERSRAGRESVQRGDVWSTGKLTIISSWRFDSCVYCWPCPSAVGNRYSLRESPWSCGGGRRTILKVR